ncbi:MAG TPA: hypothetical protein VM715_09190 [Candidatus Acidoferrum sp.]|nr:hypothetical protein [Candidatus Acidoferrum sp.]
MAESFDGREDVICGFGPSIRLGLLIMARDRRDFRLAALPF